MILSNTKFHVIKIYVFPPFYWGEGGSNQTDATLRGSGESPKEALTNFEIAKFTTKKVTEFPVKKYKFFLFFGGKEGSDQTDTTNKGCRKLPTKAPNLRFTNVPNLRPLS